MRSEKEVFDLILKIANKDSNILAVILNGSRTNKNVEKDIFQDYDLIYVVRDIEVIRNDEEFINKFGEILYMQKPEQLDYDLGEEVDLNECYGYLVQFSDGIRIDLRLMNKKRANEEIRSDKLSFVLLDKENSLVEIGQASDIDYWVKKPSQAEFNLTTNEFWWCLNNIAKGLWRQEILYTMDMIEDVVRPELKQVLIWYAGILTNFEVSVGKSGKYLDKYLPKDIYTRFLNTYSNSNIENIWESVILMCELFDGVCKIISNKLTLNYNNIEAENSFMYLNHVRSLPKDAKEIF